MITPPYPGAPEVVRLLCVEDNPDDTALLAQVLERTDPGRRYELQRVEDEDGFLRSLDSGIDVVLCGFRLPRFSPYAALEILRAQASPVPLVVLTQALGEEAAVHLLRCGAKDYVTKDKLGTLPQVIERLMEERRQLRKSEQMAAELRSAYRRLQALSARLVSAQERERNLISRELHDQLGQALAGMMMHLHVSRRTADADTARRHTDIVLEMAQGAIDKLKAMSFSLRPAQLDLLGLAATVQTAVEQIAGAAGIEFSVTTRGSEPAAPGDNASAAVRLVQEAVANAVRHASASGIQVRLRFLRDGHLVVLVVDDGIGFDKAELLNAAPDGRNLGLRGMIERTELAGGRLYVRTRPGSGVAIRAVL